MLMTDEIWGVATSDNIVSQRASLDFGLRRAMLHYAELSVPGIGGLFFVRQLLWPCLALRLQAAGTANRVSTVRFANAIEALASKTWLFANPDAPSDRHQGRVAGFRILPYRGWTFRELNAPGGYVTNPLRRAASRALPSDGGLGFCDGGAILSKMMLTDTVGERFTLSALKTKIGKGGKLLGTWLSDWADPEATLLQQPGTATLTNLLKAIGPFDPNEDERNIVLKRLLMDDSSRPRGMQDTARRRILIEVIQKHCRKGIQNFDKQVLKPLEQIGRQGQEHAIALRTARAFRQMLDAAVMVVKLCATRVPSSTSRLSVTSAAQDEDILAKLNSLRSACDEFLRVSNGDDLLQHPEAKGFARAAADRESTSALRSLVRRDERILRLDENDYLVRGPAFRTKRLDWNASEENANEVERYLGASKLPPRIANLHSLLEDCGGI